MIRVIIADDHPIVREGLKRLIAECDDMELAGEAADGEQVLVLSRDTAADVLVLDISMPGPGFLETLRRVRMASPGIRVLVLSVQPEDHYAVRCLRAGAAGYLTKERSASELTDVIRRLHSGRRYIGERLAEQLAAGLIMDPEHPLHEALSDREYEVLRQLGCGKSVTAIAEGMHLSPKTVSTYRSRILVKLQLTGTGELIRYAVEHQLCD